MRKIVLFLLAGATLVASCDKTKKQPLVYSVTNDAMATGFYNVYIPDTGTYNMDAFVKFLSGTPADSVTLIWSGLPTGIKVTPDTFSAVPTYNEHFIFSTSHMAHGSYPVTLTATTPTQVTPRVYNINVVVVPADAATMFIGALSDSNGCTGRSYKYIATGVATGNENVLTINNFGGYGPNVNVKVYFDETTDSLSIPNQVAGNGATISGYGTFTESGMIIYYHAASTPTNPAEDCTAYISK